MGTLEVDGARLHLEQIGTGPPALVLHGGLGLDHTAYRGLDPLADHLRLTYLDHRGNGRSTGDVRTATMRRWADDAAAVAAAVAGDEPVVVIGHSYGGFIAQELLLAHPGRARAAILVATTPGQLGTGEDPAPEGPPLPDGIAALFATLPETDEELAALMPRLAPAYLHRADPEALRAAMAQVVFRAAAMRRGFEELASWSSVDRLGAVEVPVLLVVGRHDPLTAWPQSERIASRLPDAELAILDHSGHLPWLDDPEAFVEAVTGWLRRRGLVRAGSAS